MTDPYAQDRAIAQANNDAEVRHERAVILELLTKLAADFAELKAAMQVVEADRVGTAALVAELKAALVKPAKASKE